MKIRMGFYLELEKEKQPSVGVIEYRERHVPPVFFFLYAVLGFALFCMGASAFYLLGDLIREGNWFDKGIVFILALSVPGYIAIGLKLFFARKFVRLSSEKVSWGYRALGKEWLVKSVERNAISGFDLSNQARTPNYAPKQHDDKQYYIRGHWRVLLKTADGRSIPLDKHTEKEALQPFFADLLAWKP